MSSKAASGESERSAPAVGQRWRAGGERGREYTITGKDAHGWMVCREGEIDPCDASYTHDGACCWFTDEWFKGATYLGWADGYGPLPPVYGRMVGELRAPDGTPRTALEAIQAKREPEPWVPAVDEWDLLPDADVRR